MKGKPALKKRLLSKDRLLRSVFFLYTLLLLFSIILSCFFSYKQRNDELLLQIDGIYNQLSTQYQKTTSNFWQLYMPFFESSSNSQGILQQYIAGSKQSTMTTAGLTQLEQLLRQMLLRDQNVNWIVIYSGNRPDNYILFRDSSGLRLLKEDFPLWEALRSDSRQMTVYSLQDAAHDKDFQDAFAICGGIPYFAEGGKILVGYSTAPLEYICNNATFHLDSLSFLLTVDNARIFEHHYATPLDAKYLTDISEKSPQFFKDGTAVAIRSELCGSKDTRLIYYASWWEVFFYSHSNTPLLIFLFLLFAVVSIVGYAYILRRMSNEVSIIQNGLNQISKNNLSYRIEGRFQQEDLSKIAHSINDMTERLNHNINLAYYYEIKQRDAQLSELQSKFNPHFLYNSLEMLRSRCQQNGDSASAKLITDMASLFRGLISSRNFIPLTEELSFSRRYLSLFSARYGDSVEIRYNFDRDVVQYGIIRNLFQPLIENYFVHGFDTSNADNYILLSGRSLDETTMVLTVEDNGIGMPLDEIERLNKKLHEPIQISTESYGLKNLHQRISLFYGGDCGLTIYPNPNHPKGLSIQMKVRKITCEEHEAMQIVPGQPVPRDISPVIIPNEKES